MVFYKNDFPLSLKKRKRQFTPFCVIVKSSLRFLDLKSEFLRQLKKLLTEPNFTFDIVQRHLLDEQVAFRMPLMFSNLCV